MVVIYSGDCCHHFLLMEGMRRHLLLVAKTQYCAVLVSPGCWYKVTVPFLFLPLQPTPLSWCVMGANAL